MSSSSPPKPFTVVLWTQIRNAFLGWVTLNILLVIAGFLFIRLTGFNTWPIQVRLATLLTGNRFINPMELTTTGTQYHDVLLRDTDGDGEQERLLFYRYDLTGGGRSPFGAVVLDMDNCRPRRLQSFELIPVDSDYLSESRYRVETRDIPDVGNANDLLIWGTTPDGIRTELSIFSWYDSAEACSLPAAGQRGYVNLGTFRGSGGISIDGSRIRVMERVFERSQLATTLIFEPREGHYRESLGGPMRSHITSAVEFTFGAPTPTAQTNYPEKTVLAFYLAVGVDPNAARAVLEDAAADRFLDGNLGKEVAEPGQLTSMAEIKQMAYSPDIEKERRHEQVTIEVQVVNRRPDGTLTGPHHYRVLVNGVPKDGAFPYNCEWRIADFQYLP